MGWGRASLDPMGENCPQHSFPSHGQIWSTSRLFLAPGRLVAGSQIPNSWNDVELRGIPSSWWVRFVGLQFLG